jgi:hypothetical protein
MDQARLRHGAAKSLLFDRAGRRLRTYVSTVNARRMRALAAGVGHGDLLFGSPGEGPPTC